MRRLRLRFHRGLARVGRMCVHFIMYVNLAVAYYEAFDAARDLDTLLVMPYTTATLATLVPLAIGLSCYFGTRDFLTAPLVGLMAFYLIAVAVPAAFFELKDDEQMWLSSVGEFDHVADTRLYGTTTAQDDAVMALCEEFLTNGATNDDDLNHILAMQCPILEKPTSSKLSSRTY